MKKWILNCDRCELHRVAHTVGMAGHIGANSIGKLAVFLDHPGREDDLRHRFGFSRTVQLLQWMLARMSVSQDDVAIQFTLRCFKPEKSLSSKAHRLSAVEACSIYRFAILQKLKPKAIAVLGRISCEAFLAGKEPKDVEGADWVASEPEVKSVCRMIWAAYSPAYALQAPAECVGIYRTLWQAAAAAGLNPTFNPTVKKFEFDL